MDLLFAPSSLEMEPSSVSYCRTSFANSRQIQKSSSAASKKSCARDGGMKKRVLTQARREQNKQSQRAYRERQKALREAKLKKCDPNVGHRTLQPKPASDTCADSLDILTPDVVEQNDHVPFDLSNHEHQPGPFPVATSDIDEDGSQLDDAILRQLYYSRVRYFPGAINISPSETPPSSDTTSNSFPSSGSQSLAIHAKPSPSLAPPWSWNTEASTYADPYLNTLQFLPTTVFSACLHNARAVGFDLFRLATCGMDYLSPFYCPEAKMGDDPVVLLEERMRKACTLDIGGGIVCGKSATQVINGGLQYNRPSQVPPNLKPTVAQVMIPHHASLDLIPIPSFREHAIMLSAAMPHLFNLYELKIDIYVRGGLLPWRDNSDSDNDCSLIPSESPSSTGHYTDDTSSSSAFQLLDSQDGNFFGLQGMEYAAAGSGVMTNRRGQRVCQPWEESSWEAAPWFLNKWRMLASRQMDQRSEWWRIVRETKRAWGTEV